MSGTAQILADNLYERLGVPTDAVPAVIKRAYHTLLRQYPPERAPEEFKRIREAYETLSNAHAREEYDTQPDPQVREWVGRAMTAMSAKRYADAERFFKRVLVQAPDLGFVRNHLGLCFLYQGRGQEAVAQFERLIRSEELAPSLFGNLAHAYALAGRPRDAVQAFTRAIEFGDEDSVSYYIGLANVYIAEKQLDRAEAILEKGIKADGRVDFWDLQFFTKLLEIQLYRRSEAGTLEVLRRIIGIVQDEEQSHYAAWKLGSLARALVEAEAFTYALPVSKTAAQLHPSDGDYTALSAAAERLANKDLNGAVQLVRSHPSFAKEGWLSDLRPSIERFCRENRVLADLQPIDTAPSLSTVNGVGFKLYGRRDYDDHTESYIATYYFVVLFIPVFPIACYRVIQRSEKSWSFLGRVPFSDAEKKHLWIFIGLLLLSVVWCSAASGGSTSTRGSISQPYGSTAPPYQPDVFPPTSDPAPAKESEPRAANPQGSAPPAAMLASDPSSLTRRELGIWIEAERIRLDSVEGALRSRITALDRKDAEMEVLDDRLRRAKADAALGLAVDEYERIRLRYNSLVDEYNGELARYRTREQSYASAVRALNRMVEKYNRWR